MSLVDIVNCAIRETLSIRSKTGRFLSVIVFNIDCLYLTAESAKSLSSFSAQLSLFYCVTIGGDPGRIMA